MNKKATLYGDSFKIKNESPLAIEIIEHEAGLDRLEREWSVLVEKADVHIFQTFEWQHTWWSIFGDKKTLQILLFRDEDELVGIMPMFIDTFRFMGITLYRCLRMIGSQLIQPSGGSLPVDMAFGGYLDVITHPDYEQEVNKSLYCYFEEVSGRFDEFILEEIPETSSLLTILLPEVMNGSLWHCELRQSSICPRLVFPESWNSWLSSLSSNSRYQIRKSLRTITEENIFQTKIAQTKDEIIEIFKKLVEYHQRRWNNLGQPGVFADTRLLEFYKKVIVRFHRKGWLLLESLNAGGRTVAVDLMYRFDKSIYLIERALDYSSEYTSHSPGKVLLNAVIKEAMDDGFDVYDFQSGEDPYKLRRANESLQNKKIIMSKIKGQKDSRRKLNSYFHHYARLKSKLKSEWHVIKVYLERPHTLSALGSYFKKFKSRLEKKIKTKGDR